MSASGGRGTLGRFWPTAAPTNRRALGSPTKNGAITSCSSSASGIPPFSCPTGRRRTAGPISPRHSGRGGTPGGIKVGQEFAELLIGLPQARAGKLVSQDDWTDVLQPHLFTIRAVDRRIGVAPRIRGAHDNLYLDPASLTSSIGSDALAAADQHSSKIILEEGHADHLRQLLRPDTDVASPARAAVPVRLFVRGDGTSAGEGYYRPGHLSRPSKRRSADGAGGGHRSRARRLVPRTSTR